MKAKFLSLALGLFTFVASAQSTFTFVDENNNEYQDGGVYTTNSLVFAESSLNYRIFNTSPNEIFMKAEIVSVNGSDGSSYEFCLGLCYFGVTEGQIIPANVPLSIEGNGDIGPGNHIWYGGPNVDPAIVTELVVRYYQTTADGNTQIGDDLTFTYIYDPNFLGVDNNTALDFDITSTVITDQLNLRIAEDMQLQLVDVNGRVVKNERLSAGTHAINVANLAPQMYLVQLTNNQRVSETTKVIKR